MTDERDAGGASRRPPQLALALGLVLAVAAGVIVANRHQPIVGNSFVYARMTYDLLERGVAACHESAFNKACGYPVLSLPFVAAFKANRGLKVSAALSTLLALGALVVFLRVMNRRAGVPPGLAGFQVLVVFLNPLMMYQFLASYSDTLFLAVALLSFVALERLLTRPDPGAKDVLAWVATLVLGLWVKHQALTLLVIQVAWVLASLDQCRRLWREHRSVVWQVVAGLAAVVGLVLLARRGLVPLFNLRAGKANYYVATQLLGRYGTLTNLLFFLAVTVHALLLVPLLRPRLRLGRVIAIVVVYLALILPNQGAEHNPRWYLPLLPFLALLVARGLAACGPRARAAVVTAFVAVNLPLSIVYNVEGAYDWLAARGLRLPAHENLGVVAEHRSYREAYTYLRDNPSGMPLYVHLFYYQGAARGVFSHGDLVDPSVEVRYFRGHEELPQDAAVVLNLVSRFLMPEVPRLMFCRRLQWPGEIFSCRALPPREGDRAKRLHFVAGVPPVPDPPAAPAGP